MKHEKLGSWVCTTVAIEESPAISVPYSNIRIQAERAVFHYMVKDADAHLQRIDIHGTRILKNGREGSTDHSLTLTSYDIQNNEVLEWLVPLVDEYRPKV